MSKPNFQIGIKKNVNANIDEIELAFYDAIRDPEYFDWNTMEMEQGNLVADVVNYVSACSPSKIIMKIDSMGGSLPIAISIYNFLKDYPAKVECKIVGFCASAATVLACAASKGKLSMPESGYFITHQASGWDIGGKADEIRQQADYVESLTNTMAEILASRNSKGKTADEIKALWVNGDKWMTGAEAEEYGFVDYCYNANAATVTARIDEAKGLFKNAPEINVTADVSEETQDVEPTNFNQLKESFMELKNFVTAAIEKIKGNKVDKTANNISAEIAEAIAQPLNEMVEGIGANVTAEITEKVGEITANITADVTEKVTAALEAKYSEKITALERSKEDLTADLERLAGRQTNGAEGGNGNASDKPRLTGKWG